MAKSSQPIPPGLETLIPHLVCSPCTEAIEFYKKAFGAEEMHRMPAPDGKREPPSGARQAHSSAAGSSEPAAVGTELRGRNGRDRLLLHHPSRAAATHRRCDPY